MPVDRPTFSESWYRVADLRPRLRSTVQVHRQHFRGQLWHVLQDRSSNDFFRLNEPAYAFVGLLDGRRTVAEAWRTCNEHLGDSAPTQGEAIQLLGQLYTSNLLHADLPPDAEGLLKRYRRRRARRVQGVVTNLLFLQIPLIDPNRFLSRWVGLFGRLFTWYGLLGWVALLAVGLHAVSGRLGELRAGFGGALAPENLPLLYLAVAVTKVFHEFGHAFACKRFGRRAGGGEVHQMGIMLLVFMPLPYVDASSAWALRRKSHRAIIGAAGMFVELAVAAVAAIVWAQTAEGSALHALCFNVMLTASVSTLLFNGNPLLRYDAYYILSDLVEIPNLSARSKQYLYFLVRRYLWGVRRPVNPAHSPGERVWFVAYGIASTVYRVMVCVYILLFVADKLFFVGVMLAAGAAVAWLLVPIGRFLRYLGTSGELSRTRPRAVATVLIFATAVLTGVGILDFPDHRKAQGMVVPIRPSEVEAAVEGFVESVLPSGSTVRAGDELVRCFNLPLEATYERLLAERALLEAQIGIAAKRDPAVEKVRRHDLDALGVEIDRLRKELEALVLRSPRDGVWLSKDAHHLTGHYLRPGDRVGLVADLDALMIRTVVRQDDAAVLDEADPRVEIRPRGRPDVQLTGIADKRLPGGRRELPSAALGHAAGGSVPTAPDDPKGLRSAEEFFEVHVVPEQSGVRLLPRQCVVVRFTMPARPLAEQWWRSLTQLVQRRFRS